MGSSPVRREAAAPGWGSNGSNLGKSTSANSLLCPPFNPWTAPVIRREDQDAVAPPLWITASPSRSFGGERWRDKGN